MIKKKIGSESGIALNRDDFPNRFIERFWGLVEVGDEDECWLWKGALLNGGYGVISKTAQMLEDEVGGKNTTMLAHRASYTIAYGSVEAKKVVRHMCHNKRCVNPDHLESGTQAQNALDSSEFKVKDYVKKIRELRALKLQFTTISSMLGISPYYVRRVVRNEIFPDPKWSDPVPMYVGDGHHMSKLTDALVVFYREKWSSGEMSVSEVHQELEVYDVSRSTVSDMLNGKSWKHLPILPAPVRTRGRKWNKEAA